jgi:tyrosine-protein phosphatase non-receptor type 1
MGRIYAADNRYKNVFPWDHNILKVNGVYFNASVLQLEGRVYVATQAPLPHTMKQFFELILENNIDTIVCLVRQDESLQKFHPYWTQEYDMEDISVKVLSESGQKVILRKLQISRRGIPEKEIKQYHLTTWPDFGIADSESVNEVLEKSRQSKHPLLVHCSAGIGRSGTFILADVLQRSPNADPNEILKSMRLMRPGMVQTKEQFEMAINLSLRSP